MPIDLDTSHYIYETIPSLLCTFESFYSNFQNLSNLNANDVLRVMDLVGCALDDEHLLLRIGRRLARQLTVGTRFAVDLNNFKVSFSRPPFFFLQNCFYFNPSYVEL